MLQPNVYISNRCFQVILYSKFHHGALYRPAQISALSLGYRRMRSSYLLHHLWWTVEIICLFWKSHLVQSLSGATYSLWDTRMHCWKCLFWQERTVVEMHWPVEMTHTEMYPVKVVLRGVQKLENGSLALNVTCKAPLSTMTGGRSTFFGEQYVAAAFGNGWVKDFMRRQTGTKSLKIRKYHKIIIMREESRLWVLLK